MGDALYFVVRAFVQLWIWIFFRRIQVRHLERVPPRGPVVLAVNHPNNLIDTLVIGTIIHRKIHYLATATLFRNPFLAPFLRRMGVIPIHRRQDAADTAERNVTAFEACYHALDAGAVIGIYPEGTTHAEQRVQRIKTGAARIVLEAEARRDGRLGIRLIPVGLTFSARKSFRSAVLISFGDPLDLTAHLARYASAPMEAVEQLTEAIQVAMRAQIPHVERPDLTSLVRDVEALYKGDLIRVLMTSRGLTSREIDPLRLSQKIVAAIHYYDTHDPERLLSIRRRLDRYEIALRMLRLRDGALHQERGTWTLRRHLWSALLGLLGFPLFLYGELMNLLPYSFPRFLSRRLARKETDYATAKLLVIVVALPLFYGLQTWLVWRVFGRTVGLLYGASLPLSGLFALRYWAEIRGMIRSLRVSYLNLTRRQMVTSLLKEREQLIAELDAAREDFLLATRES